MSKNIDYRKLIKAAMIITAVGVAFCAGFVAAFSPRQDKQAVAVVSSMLVWLVIANLAIYLVYLWLRMVAEMNNNREGGYRAGKLTYRQGWWAGVFSGLLLAQGGFNFMDTYKDPLHFALRAGQTANIQPENIADKLLQYPWKQRSWKELRACIAQIDDEVGQKLEQAGGSQESAKHWKDPTNLPCPPG